MAKTAIVWDEFFQKHDTGPGHPERSERLAAIGEELTRRGLMSKLERVPARPATAEEILRVHTPTHLERVQGTAGRHTYLDGDTPTSPDSYQSALLAAGGLIDLTTAVAARKIDNGFALVRPPGHHAEPDRAMGFCLFNNIAIAARHALETLGLKKILIVDWDVHHGNSTQHVFYPDPRVLFFSIHRYPFYPGTGGVDEIGVGPGKGYTVNFPAPGGQGDPLFETAFAHGLEPVARAFKPELVLVSAGFDAHQADPLGGMNVSEDGFARLAARVLALAEEFAGGRLVATLEGGYDLAGLAGGVAAVTEVWMGKTNLKPTEPAGSAVAKKILEAQRQCLGQFWPGLGDAQ